jgi:heme/copper-type cytochrome/quinol oxidase subunit 1
MPRLTVWFIRAGLAYLAAGFTFGALMLFNKGLPLSPLVWRLLPAHIEFLLVGWTVQLIMGVAFWVLPRFSRAPRRGDIRLAWLAFLLLNGGIGLVVASPLISGLSWLNLLGRCAQAGAALAFALHAWPRVKPT